MKESYRYDAFGTPTIYNAANPPQVIASSAIGNRLLFTGREYNSQFGFYEYRARAYHPGLGRFMSEDPKGFDAGDYNWFRYCHNDPWDLTDPMGLKDMPVPEGMDQLGMQASFNSLAAAHSTEGMADHMDRAQLIQGLGTGKNMKLSLQNHVVKGVEGNREKVHKDTGFRWVHKQTEKLPPDKGFSAQGVGHVHRDQTGKGGEAKSDWSGHDIGQAQKGRFVYRVDESNPAVVYRLNPQENHRDPPTTTVIKVNRGE